MSTRLLLFLLFLSLSAHACNARHHNVFYKASPKGVEKMKCTKTQLKTMFDELGSERKQPTNRGHVGASTEKPKYSEPIPRIMYETRGMAKGFVRTESLATVSWKIPKEKHGKDPRFDLDYAPPRTHPPSHN